MRTKSRTLSESQPLICRMRTAEITAEKIAPLEAKGRILALYLHSAPKNVPFAPKTVGTYISVLLCGIRRLKEKSVFISADFGAYS